MQYVRSVLKMKIAYINGCYDCPYAVWSLSEERRVCSILHDDKLVTNCEITFETLSLKITLGDCPLDDSS